MIAVDDPVTVKVRVTIEADSEGRTSRETVTYTVVEGSPVRGQVQALSRDVIASLARTVLGLAK